MDMEVKGNMEDRFDIEQVIKILGLKIRAEQADGGADFDVACRIALNKLLKVKGYEGLENRLKEQFNGCVDLKMIIDAIIEYDKQLGRDEKLAKAMLITNDSVRKFCEWESLDEQGQLLIPPCAVGDTVYVLAECEKIPQQLDGTLYEGDGSLGTATGYYYPYESDCPFDDEDFECCEKYAKQTEVFEDTVKSITYDECGIWISTENCSVCSEIGRYIFLTREEAKTALKAMEL